MFNTLEINVAAPVQPVVVNVIADCLLLNVDQSVLLKAPLLVALAVGTFKVITGVVVPFTTELDKSVPIVPIVKADTFVTVPKQLVFELKEFQSVLVSNPLQVVDALDILNVKVPFVVIGLPPIVTPVVDVVAATQVTVPKQLVFELKFVQSVVLNSPLFKDEAVGILKVCVDVELDILKSVPLVPVAKV